MASVTTEPVRDSVAKVNEEIAVGEDLTFQRSWWRFERGVWLFFILLIALDLAGVFGRGPVAQGHLRSSDGALDVHYERIERTGTPSMMTITLGPSAIHDGSARLFVSERVVGGLGAQRIIPQPTRSEIGHGGLTYSFPASVPPASVRIELQPAGPGLDRFQIGIPGTPPLEATVLVMP